MKVEFLYRPGCRTEQSARMLLETVLAEAGASAVIKPIPVRTVEEAAGHLFPGSPTIRIDGRDIDPAIANDPSGGQVGLG
jgi:hypothetical protein